MNKPAIILVTAACISLCALPALAQPAVSPLSVRLEIDASKKLQQIDGIGVNANTRAWNDNDLHPAIDLLLDSVHANIWRVIVETVEKWEEVNDNDDPFKFNWDYYNKLYETPKFERAWDMIRYLNQRGIRKNLMINFMGIVPRWMGGPEVKTEFEDEYIEMLVSFFYYAKNNRHLEIGLISPMNEPDISHEGPTVGPEQYARLVKKFLLRMDAVGLGSIGCVAPDVASMESGIEKYIPLMMKEPVIMKKLAHIGLHTYGGYYAPVDSTLKKSEYPKSDFWITEWNAWCKGCDDGILGEYNYAFASKSVGFLLDLLRNGARAGLAWEAYDSYYEHHAPSLFSYWGMLAYEPETRTYTPRKNFYAIQQVSRFVPPGSWSVEVGEPRDSLSVMAFHHPESKTVTIVGINRRKHTPLSLEGSLKSFPTIKNLKLYYTDEQKNVYKDNHVMAKGKSFTASIPSNCIFTVTGTTD